MKHIEGYEGLYLISESGDIFRGGKKLKNSIDTNKYLSIALCKNGKVRRYRVHRLVAGAYIDNPAGKAQVNHKNGVRSDNRVKNLEWATPSENNMHANRVLGRSPPMSMAGKYGKDHNRSKAFVMQNPAGELYKFNSGLEARRLFNLDHTSISYMAKNRDLPHRFKRGKLKDWALLAYNV